VACLDTVRADTFSALERAGEEDALSPWERRALRFRRTLAPSPWTLPSVASLLTGRWPNEHAGGSYGERIAHLEKEPPPPLAREVATLFDALAARGYRTRGFSANPFVSERFGFEGVRLERRAGRERLLTTALRWLDGASQAERRRPFFLYLHFMDAHLAQREARRGPAAPEALPARLRPAALAAAPASLCSGDRPRECEAFLAYARAVFGLRVAVARLLGALEERGALGETIVVLFSDHGEEFFEHLEEGRRRGTDPRGVYGYGHGHTLYQELLEVPLRIWHPRLAPRTVEGPASLVDVAPTLLEWLGVAAPELRSSGTSLAAALAAGQASLPERTLFASALGYGPPERAVVAGRWKRIVRSQPEERLLFDLATDPFERTPLAGLPEASRLDAWLDAYARRAGPGEGPAQLAPDTLEALRELGYLEAAPPP
jgi:arylsulfatase A-like enzyme